MWSAASSTRHVNGGLPPEFFFVAPASSFHHPEAAATTTTTTINFDPHNAVGVIPLLTAAPCLAPLGGGGGDDDMMNTLRRGGSGMQLWQHHQQGQNSPAYLKKPIFSDQGNLLQTGNSGGATASGGGIGVSSSIGATTCQDCGNQAKKDCPHRRCRTCCKSRGYDCSTHVKSTWVPAARRRERQLATTNTAAGSSQSTSGAKKPRLGGGPQTNTTTSHTSNSNNTPPRSFETSSSHQDGGVKDSLPGQVRAPAVFKCVRVTALDDGEDEYAYQAVVRIGGHVFKGFLYDQGFEGREGFPNMSELNLGSGGGGGGGRNGGSSSPPVDAAEIYGGGASGGGLLGGSGFGNPMN